MKVIDLVQIHGNWCGPNWTAGRNISARDYKLAGGDFKSPCIDRLDCACRTHDKECSGKRGCTKAADAKLARKAAAIQFTTRDPILRAKAAAVASTFAVTTLFRRT